MDRGQIDPMLGVFLGVVVSVLIIALIWHFNPLVVFTDNIDLASKSSVENLGQEIVSTAPGRRGTQDIQLAKGYVIYGKDKLDNEYPFAFTDSYPLCKGKACLCLWKEKAFENREAPEQCEVLTSVQSISFQDAHAALEAQEKDDGEGFYVHLKPTEQSVVLTIEKDADNNVILS